MANTLTNLRDVKVAQRALKAFVKKLGPVSRFSTNFSAEAAERNATVNVPLIGSAPASQDFAGDYLVNIDRTADARTVPLDRHKFQTVHMTATEYNSTSVDIMGDLVEAAVRRLAEDVYVDILGVVKANIYGTAIPALAASAMTYAKMVDVRAACNADAVKMPEDGRGLWIDDTYYSNLLVDDVVAKSPDVTISGGTVREAKIKQIAGFDVFPSIVIPENGEKLKGFAAVPSAIAICNRYMVPVADYQEAGAVTDPETGLTFGYLRHSETRSNRVFVTVECLYGRTHGIPEGLLRIVRP
ncbi:hypothetical protein DB346_05490 [Verrucomicrobia bacterium LW23]|nr:hypothetical protein DB346_05490 [Verrucomicrobia bacterium LW23]